MKYILFAGGIGTRMWPASRVKHPKQFNSVLNGKSSLELMFDHLIQIANPSDIFVSTNNEYVQMVKERLVDLPEENIFQEPAMRDLGPAVGYAIGVLNLKFPNEPVAILWCDDLIKNRESFHKVLKMAEDYSLQNTNKFIYIGVHPLFADQNKGWIKYGNVITHQNGISMYDFVNWHYRPPLELAQSYFHDGLHAVNTGYFVTTPNFVMNLYQQFAPQMFNQLNEIIASWNTDKHSELLNQIYPNLEKISFDDLIVSKTSSIDGVVLVADFGWYGFGDWESIKTALQESPQDVVTNGNVYPVNSKDCLVYSYTDQLVTPIGLEGMIVVVTQDAVMLCPQSEIPEVKKMLKNFKGTELEKYT